MPKCRSIPGRERNRVSVAVPVALKEDGNHGPGAEFGGATRRFWSSRYDAATLSLGSEQQIFDRHAALLEDGRLSRSANGIQRAIIVRKLERDYGAWHVHHLFEYISSQRAAGRRAKNKNSGARDGKTPDSAAAPHGRPRN